MVVFGYKIVHIYIYLYDPPTYTNARTHLRTLDKWKKKRKNENRGKQLMSKDYAEMCSLKSAKLKSVVDFAFVPIISL